MDEAEEEEAEEEEADRGATAIGATGACPTASRPGAGRTAALLSTRAAVPVPVASDRPAAGVVGEEAGAAPTADEAEAAVGEEAGVVASVPAAAAAAADSVPNATHRSASAMVPCPPPADRSPLAVCPRVEVGLDPVAALAAVLRPPLPCPIGPVCTARHTNGLNPLVERVRTNISRSSNSIKATTPSFVAAVVVAAMVEEKGEATAHPVRQNSG